MTTTTCSTQVNIIQGEDRTINFGIKDVDEDVFIDLTGVTAMTVTTNDTSTGTVVVTLAAVEIVITDATKGQFKATWSDTKTALMKLGELNLEVVIDWGTNRRIVQLLKAIKVSKKLF